MSDYEYLWCEIHNEYIHLGKAGRDNYENPGTSRSFIDKHYSCWLKPVGSYDDELFCKMCEGTEFDNRQQG